VLVPLQMYCWHETRRQRSASRRAAIGAFSRGRRGAKTLHVSSVFIPADRLGIGPASAIAFEIG
jgi:hypothetical protein